MVSEIPSFFYKMSQYNALNSWGYLLMNISTGRHIHIQYVLNCLKCVIHYYRVRHRLTKEAPISIHYTLCYLHIMYCLSIWGCAWSSYLNNVFLIQKRIGRTISFKGTYDSTTLKLLNFQSVYKYFLVFTLFKSIRFSPCNEPFFFLC